MTVTSVSSPHARHALRDYLKQIVYGGNDGIVTTFAIVAGFAGAQADGVAQIGGIAVVVFGLANLFADAVSMGLGEFLSARSQHQLYRRHRRLTLADIDAAPAQQARRLAEMYQAQGLEAGAATQAAAAFQEHPSLFAEQLLSYGNIGPAPERENPAVNGGMTFLAFVIFGGLPILPYVVREADALSFQLSCGAALLALTLLGALRGWATQEPMARAQLETVGVGALCAGVAFFVGWLVGG